MARTQAAIQRRRGKLLLNDCEVGAVGLLSSPASISLVPIHLAVGRVWRSGNQADRHSQAIYKGVRVLFLESKNFYLDARRMGVILIVESNHGLLNV